MIDVAQSLKNNIGLFVLLMIGASASSFFCGLLVSAKLPGLALFPGIAAIGCAAGVWAIWKKISTQIDIMKGNFHYAESDEEENQ